MGLDQIWIEMGGRVWWEEKMGSGKGLVSSAFAGGGLTVSGREGRD